MNLMKLLKNTEYKGEYIDLDISSISHDSRKINKDGLFVSLKGKKDDGDNYIDQAISNGAIAVLTNNEDIKIKNNISFSFWRNISIENFYTRQVLSIIYNASMRISLI